MPIAYTIIYKKYSETSVLLEWPAIIDEKILEDLLSFKNKITTFYGSLIVEVISGYNALLVCYQKPVNDFSKEVATLKSIYSSKESLQIKKRLWNIPVCYSSEFAIDLPEFAREKSMTTEEVVALHTNTSYTLYFIGFLPGFLYLGGLDKRLHMPRKNTPTMKVEKGSVGIGGSQTGIYPIDSPGGWHIIGKSPVSLFEVSSEVPSRFRAGDRIRFESVSTSKYYDIKEQVINGILEYKPEVNDS